MTRVIGLAGSVLLMALATCALVAASASANAQFNPEVDTFSTTSTTSTFYVSGVATIHCTSDKGTGGTTSKEGLSWVSFLFEGCSSAFRCGTTLGFEALSGETGTVASAEATSERGVMLKFGSTMECGTEVLKIRGTIAGEFTPKTTEFKHKLNFEVATGNVPKIKTIHTKNGTIEPKLEISINGSLFKPAALVSNETNTFTEKIEMT
jgi:hypothetical protein